MMPRTSTSEERKFMESTFKPGICGLLEGMQTIRERMVRDEATLEHMYANVQRLIQQGSSSGNHVLDIVLRYGLPYELPHLEQNLRRLDEQLKRCVGQSILIELITPSPAQSKEPARHQTIVGVIAANQPLMRYIDEKRKFSGIELAVQGKEQVLLSEGVITEYKREDRPHLGALLNSGEAFSIFIGHEAVMNYLLPTHISKSIPEEEKTRAARTTRIARELNDLMIDYGMFIDGHRVLQNFIRSASYP